MPNSFKSNNTPLLIAGPCSIESEQQLLSVTEMLLQQGVKWIRGGVWKPRTRPGGFEGYGAEALAWISTTRKVFPEARFCCEVANPEHVELCLKHGIDGVWIGSRTVGNPFSISEICESLMGTHLPVLVKNPMNPDIKLWIGAIERVLQTGTESVAAVHRGFSLYNNMGYRNNPLWEVPIELRRLMPELPILCDPSHIAGKRELIGSLMQTALDLLCDGFMVEVHPNPDEALTDKDQQLSPEEFHSLIQHLNFRNDNNDTPVALNILREQIDHIDAQLIELLKQRFSVSKKIAQVKEQNNMTVYQPKRWEEVLEKKISLAKQAGIDPNFIKELYEKVHAESVRVQLEDTEH